MTNNEEVVNCLIHRLQMLHIIKLYQERQSLVLMQITERILSCHGEALPKGIYARRQERNLILAHLSIIYNMLLYIAAKLMN